MGQDIRGASPRGYAGLLAACCPDGAGCLDLRPLFELMTIHELGHAFEVPGDLRLPAFWLGEIFADLVLHAFIATSRPESLGTLQTLSAVGASGRRIPARWRAEGYTTLQELEAHYTDGEQPAGALNYA